MGTTKTVPLESYGKSISTSIAPKVALALRYVRSARARLREHLSELEDFDVAAAEADEALRRAELWLEEVLWLKTQEAQEEETRVESY